MSELIADLPYRIVAPGGREYYMSVAGEQRADGEWEGWLEFVPDDEGDVLVTPTETTQSNRASLERWADKLEETYVQGAFRRALDAAAPGPARLVARRVAPTSTAVPAEILDPFALFEEGRLVLRDRLNRLERPALLHVIEQHGLNPAGKSLAWLSDRQLVTFIDTAVEAQLLGGMR